MKTKILLFFVLFTTFCEAQILNIPSSNFKTVLLNASASNVVASTQTPNILGFVTTYTAIDTNNNGEIEESEAALITYLDISNASISDLSGISGFVNLRSLNCENNLLTIFDINQNQNLNYLFCSNNQLTSLNVTENANLLYLYCDNNQLTTLNSTQNQSLQNLSCSYNPLVNIDVTQNPSLEALFCIENQLTDLDVTQNPNLIHLNCASNQLTTLDLTQNPNLGFIRCDNNQLTTLDITQSPNVYQLWCTNNQLANLFLKNNGISFVYLYFGGNPNLQYICSDENDVAIIQQKIVDLGYTNCHVNTYCSFTPNGTFYTIEGNTKYDYDNNGCDANDFTYPYLKSTINNGATSGSFYANYAGNYFIPVQQGNYLITPNLEIPTYFNITPNIFNVDFPASASPYLQDFCITANGIHHDVEVFIIPVNQAIPGFDARYKIVYKNKGTNTQSGAIDFSFEDVVLDFISSNPPLTSQSTGHLIWNFANLLPFESREIDITLNLNEPTETPALNSGDILNYLASINGQTDETPNDNIATLNQTVFNSYDPNDKTCLEGTTILPSMVGEYVHYLIRFENNGTANAQNIVVKDLIDTDKFDIQTLIPIHASHSFETRISNTNMVEFIFQNINLPFDDTNNDGYVSFKIKTKSNLVVENTFSNAANIYFDYNFPIITNNYVTTVQNTLSSQAHDLMHEIVMYPSPVKDFLIFKTELTILKVEIFDFAGRIISSNSVSDYKIDLRALKSGNYILKLYTEKGAINTTITKE